MGAVVGLLVRIRRRRGRFGTLPGMATPLVELAPAVRYAALAGLLLLSGCATPTTPGTLPTPAPSEARLTPSDGTSLRDRTIQHPLFTMQVPAPYEEQRGDLDRVTVARWSRPNPDGPLEVAVAVVVESSPTQPLADQAAALELRLREENHEVERIGLAWPDAAQAQLISWREGVRGTGTFREVWQLMAQRADGTIYSVVAFGPFDTFDSSGLPEVLATFRIRP